MSTSSRIVVPELLDDLPPADPRACRSRRDLQRVHRAMGSLGIMQNAVARLHFAAPPRHIVELGAGDGSLMLRLAQSLKPRWRDVSLTLLDRHDIVSAQTRAAFRALDWRVTVTTQDALAWAVTRHPQPYDLCVTTLFLHHFDVDALSLLMRGIAMNARALVACEPRRGLLARIGSGLIGALGTNGVTREDAVKSVAAGLRGKELSAVWPYSPRTWTCDEYSALPFTHCFTAVRND